VANLVDHQFEVNGTFAVLQATFVEYVLGPGAAFHVNQCVSWKTITVDETNNHFLITIFGNELTRLVLFLTNAVVFQKLRRIRNNRDYCLTFNKTKNRYKFHGFFVVCCRQFVV